MTIFDCHTIDRVDNKTTKQIRLMRANLLDVEYEYVLTSQCLFCVCGCSYRCSSAPVEPGHMTAAAHVQSFLFPGHSSCISQLLAFHKAKARMDPPANSHRRTESVWGGWEPTGMQRWLRMQCTAIYIYIYIYRIYTKQQ